MAMTTFQFMTLENLQTYDSKVKTWVEGKISTSEAKSIKAVGIVGNALKFYKVENPTADTVAAFSIDLPETDLSNLLEKFNGATAGDVVTVAADGKTIADSGVKLADLATKTEVSAVDGKANANADAIAAINNETTGILKTAKDYADGKVTDLANGAVKANTDAIALLNGSENEAGSVAKAVKDAKDEINGTIGTVAEGKTVVQMIEDAKADATYDDTVLKGRMTTVEEKVAVLEGDETTIGSVKKAVKDAKDELTTEINKKANAATTLAGYGITDAYTKTEADQMADDKIKAALTSALVYKGTVATYDDLPTADVKIGDVYNITTTDPSHDVKAGDNVAWNGTGWDVLAGTVDLSAYSTTIQVEGLISAAKTEAINTAAGDATSKANQALADAKEYANGLSGNYATAAQGAKADSALQQADIVEGTTNGTIKVKGTDVPVHGLDSAAYAKTTDFDAAGAADAVLGTSADGATANTVYGAKAAVTALADGQVTTNKNDIATMRAEIDKIEGIPTASIEALFA